MKTVILFRHGKSDWDVNFESDHARPVAPRGVKAARQMGRWLTATDQAPDFLVSSSALRARTTMDLAREAGEWPQKPVIANELYEASVADYVEVMRQTPQRAGSVLLAGHEPTCSLTTEYLTGGGRVRFPTGAMARIDFGTDTWQDIGQGEGTLIWFLPPRFLPD